MPVPQEFSYCICTSFTCNVLYQVRINSYNSLLPCNLPPASEPYCHQSISIQPNLILRTVTELCHPTIDRILTL